MKKIVAFMKKWLLIPFCCLLLFFPAWSFGIMIGWFFGMTFYELFGFGDFLVLAGMLLTGLITALPIIYKVRQSERMKTWVRHVVILASVLFFTFLACLLMVL